MMIVALGISITKGVFIKAVELGKVGTNTVATQEGCAIKIETTEKVSWTLPRQPIDLVILQDTSGSFRNTIHYVQEALKQLTTPVKAEEYDERNPRLVFTGNEATTDRVMVNTFQGVDGTNYYDAPYTEYDYWGRLITTYPSDSNFTVPSGTRRQSDPNLVYQFKDSPLMSSKEEIDSYINAFRPDGGTPTVPAIDETIAKYNAIKGNMGNRKTVFLLVTDGVANGVRRNGEVVIERSRYREYALQSYFEQQGVEEASRYLPEASQDYLSRARELVEAGNKLRALVKSDDGNTQNDGAVVVGFWEQVSDFTKASQYGTTYLRGFANTGVNTGDTRTVQEVFHQALRSVATSDKYYVNEQSDPEAFADRILKSVAQALVKEDVQGEFTVTEGYTVKSVTINKKKIVDVVKDPTKEIRGTIKQAGQNVTISVPEGVFNPGENSFDYELNHVEDPETLSEEDEKEPADDYVPSKKNVTVGQLTGTFKVGKHETAMIGSKTPTSVEVTDLKYCYPNVTKTITDQDKSNDIGTLQGYPEGAIRPSYAANLTEASENFSYDLTYRMNNLPLNVKKNFMLVDELDYRLEYKSAYVTDTSGARTNFEVKTKEVADPYTGKTQTVVYAVIPPKAGDTSNPNVNEGLYGGHKFARYTLHIETKIKDDYTYKNNPEAYKALIQENDGYGILNQGKIIWDGEDDNPTDPRASVRRSNAVYVVPPVETDIKKDVQSVDGTGEGYVKDQDQLYLGTRSQEYYYNVESAWPGLADSYTLTDTLVPELEFVTTYGNKGAKITVNGNEVKALTDKLTFDGNTVTLKLTKADFTARAISRQITTANRGNKGPAVIKLTIKAKIKDTADLTKYVVNGQIKVPNKATVELNGKPQTSNTVYVTPDEPAPSKKINSTHDVLHTTKSSEAFEFNIQTKLPRDIKSYKSYKITDKLDSRLELTNSPAPYVKEPYAQHFDVTHDATTNTVTATAKATSLSTLTGGEMVELVIPAKIKDGTSVEEIPNTSKIVYETPTSGGEKETPPTPPVVVTPPPLIEKQVNAKQHADLTKRDEVFEYTIKSSVPKGAETFEITDELDEALEFAGNQGDVVVKIADTAVTDKVEVTRTGRNLGIKFTKEQLTADAGKTIVITFKAKIRGDVNLSVDKYTQDGTIKVPNKAKYTLNNNPKESNTVTVTPPTPTPPTVEKKVNDKVHETLGQRNQTFDYSIATQVPTDAKSFVITDELKEVLEFAGNDGKGEVVVKIGDAIVTNTTDVKTENQTLTVSLTADQLAKLQGQKVLVTFKAKIVANADLTAYTANGTTKVPNTANFVINNDFTTKKETEPVTVTPPGETPTPKKTVNDKQAEKLSNLDEVFTYKVTAEVPKNTAGFTKFELSDDLEDILTITETGVTVGDATLDKGMTVASPKDANADSGKVTAALPTNEISKYAGKTVVLTIKARIKEGVQSFELAKYITADNQEGSIPNKATLTVGDKPDQKKDSNNVPVTPPSEDPTVTKKINDKLEHLDTETATNYTYNIKTKLPADITTYKKFVISDELDAELAVQGKPVISGPAAQFFDVKVEGQLVTATMKNFVTAQELAGKEVELVIVSQIRKGVTTQNIPNIARITYQNRTHAAGTPDSKKDTPPVTVTPPGETPTVEKKINKDLTEATVLPESNYTYNITSLLPVDITRYKAYAIVDELDENLAIQGTPVMAKIDGVDMTQFFDVKVAGQKVTATMKNFENAAALAGKKVELVITAQVKSTSKAPKIDNTAKVTYQNKSHVDGTPDSETPPTPPVTVTPPPVTKKINETLDHLDTATKTNYNYNIKTVLPSDIASYKTFVINDDLDKELEVQGTPIIKGDAAKFFKVTVDGQKVRATITDFNVAKAYAGKEVELVIVSQIREGVTRQAIPNQTTITYTNKVKAGGEPGDTTTTPPTPPVTVTPPGEDPTVEKKINNTLDHLDVDTEKDYTYNITTTLPVDITSYKKFAIVDVLDKDLAVQGTPTITGEAAKFFDVKVDGQTVTAEMKDFKNAKDLAGKKVELVIVSQIREGVTRQAIPNTAKVTYQNKSHVDGTPDSEAPPTPPVTVTPPGEDPTVEKKINRDLTEAVVLPESNYTYNITSTLPVDITSYKAYAIVDELDENLSIQGTPVVTGDAAKFFDVTVTGNTVKATMKDFKQVKDLAGKQVELVITAQVKSTSTATKIDNTAKVTYQNKNHVDGEPDSETPPTPPVTVTTPPVTKKINENLDHLDTATQTNYTYNIKTVLPTDIATYKRFVITDSLESELAVQGIPTMTGDAAKFFDVKVEGQVVTATITDFEAAKAMAGKEVELVIVSQIREGVTRQAIPNQTTISYTNKAKADGTPGDVTTTPPTPPVTVTPPGDTPTVEKKINRDLTEAVVLPESNYTYNITSTLPVDITSYKAYAIVDELDENLSIQGTPVVTGDAAKFFDVTVTGNTVKATMKDFKQVKDLAGKQVELVITAQVKSTSTATKIDNTAKVTYQNKNHVDGEPDSETPPTPPVTVTTPPVTKKINENLDHLDTATQTNYTYNIKTVLPTDIANYKRFVITDSLEGELAVQGIPTMTGDAAKFFDVKVEGQVVTATITDFEAAKAMAGKEVELVIVSQIREGVTRQAIPNQTTISYTNKAKADGTPGDVTTTPPTPPVTVTPPGETPTVEKKINRDLDHLDIETEKDYNYNITTNLPVDIVSYKRYVLTDTLDQDLAIQGTPVITGEAAKFFDVTVEGQTVTATMKDFKQAKDLAGKQVELVITAQVREGITRPNIPNTAKVEFTNKSDQTGEKETKPVTVTPPTPNTPPIEKKVNGAASAELASRQEVFTYTIDTVVPTGAFAFEVNDTLEDVLAFEEEVTATLAGKALSANQITVAGQTVTVKLTKEQVRQQAGAPLQVVFFAKVKDGADLTPYMTDGRTSVPNTASYIINNDPSTKKDSNTVPVYPPTPNEPSVDKKINRDLTHLDVEVNKSYMYNVTADLPQDIATYKEFVVTDIVEPVLAINGEVVAYVDGYATDAVKVTVEGNRVVASVIDFSRLAGFKQIQLYIPAYIKSDADLTAYMKDNAASIPNTASLDFTDSNGVKKRKETTPVTVTPPTPDTPPTPPVKPPQPGTPVKTVSRVAGLEQTDYLALLLATENFRFDIKSVVPMDEADDKRLNLTSLAITDQMDNFFTVSPDKVAVKVTNAPTANANYIDEDVEKAQAALDVEVAKLEAIKQSAQTDTSTAALTEAQNLLATLEVEWTAAEAKLAELTAANTVTTSSTPASTTAELTEAPVETPAVDYASEIAAQKALMAELQAKLDEAKTQVQTAQAALSTAKTAAEVKVEVENQEKVVAEKQTVLDEAKKRQAIVQERIAQLANVNEKGELTAQAIVALGGSIKVEGQLVTVDFTDEYTMEALKGYTVNVIIYSSISDVDALTKDHFTIGIDNTATVQFNHDPSEQLTKKTNKVTVVPPKNDTPPPPPTTPEKPKGELPTPPTPPTTPPAESTPPTPGKTLPKTGVAENGMYALVGMILGTLTLVFRRRKQ
ncbi:isopeptide-forming domain-containing fimbrial protein [Streptococcus suis]|nr:isopeptide-forming domain-containing fimbrial protein [Streptococcus suis]